jgi:hypothetical protein
VPACRAEVSLTRTSEGDGKSSALLIEGAQQIAPLASGEERLGFRGVTRVVVTDAAIRGAWAYGLVLRSTHLAQVETLNVVGVGVNRGSSVAILMDGAGAPTGHTIENVRAFFYGMGAREWLPADIVGANIAGSLSPRLWAHWRAHCRTRAPFVSMRTACLQQRRVAQCVAA